ncbi:MAG TPA: hypothetical protein VGG75_29690 [Trebonia sp.]
MLTRGLRPVPDRRRLARQVGVVFGQRSQPWWDLPVRESFRILAAIHALTRTEESGRTAELVEQLELGEFLSTSPCRNPASKTSCAASTPRAAESSRRAAVTAASRPCLNR